MTAKAQVLYKAQGDVLAAYDQSRKRVQIIRGPLGSGKTYASAFKLFNYMCSEKPKNGIRRSEWVVTRATLPQLKSSAINDWMAVVPKGTGKFTFGPPPVHDLDFFLDDGTRVVSKVWFIALDSPAAVEKVRGMNLTGGWLNEVKQLQKIVFNTTLSRTGRYEGYEWHNWSGVIADTNAWDDDNWLQTMYDEWRMGNLPDWEFFVQPPGVIKSQTGLWMPNPECEGPPGVTSYYQREMQGKTETWIKVNLANQNGLSLDGKPVHPDFNDEMHTAHETLVPLPGVVYVGIDFGLTPAAAFFQRQPTGQWYGLDEIVIEDGDAKLLADEIKAKCATMRSLYGELTFVFRGDPSGDIRSQADSNTAFSVLRANGVPALPASTNDPELRRAALDRPLTRMVNGQPGILFSPNMKKLRKALAGGFHYERLKVLDEQSRFRDVPVKDMNSHIAEAAEYALMDAGEHGIINARTGTSESLVNQPPPRVVIPGRGWSPYDS